MNTSQNTINLKREKKRFNRLPLAFHSYIFIQSHSLNNNHYCCGCCPSCFFFACRFISLNFFLSLTCKRIFFSFWFFLIVFFWMFVNFAIKFTAIDLDGNVSFHFVRLCSFEAAMKNRIKYTLNH